MSTSAEQITPDSTEGTQVTPDPTEDARESQTTDGKRQYVTQDEEEYQEEYYQDEDSFADILAKKRADVSRAKARMAYTARELELRKQRVELDAAMEMLHLEREAAEAEADCQAFESTMIQMSPMKRRTSSLGEVSNFKPGQDQSTPRQPSASPGLLTGTSDPTQLDPDAQPYVPAAQPLVPDTQPSVPVAQPYVPTAQPYVRAAQPYVPAPQPNVPAAQPYVPAAQPHVPAAQPYVPAAQPHVPAAQPHVPAAQPYVPAAQPHMPAAQPHVPAAQPYVPAAQPHVPAAQPHVPAAQPHVPAAQPSMPAAQPHVPAAHPHVPTAHPHVPVAQPYVAASHPLSPLVTDQGPQVTDVTRFLLRKDLLFSRLTHFDDRPESYSAWKHSFMCVVNELQVLDSEQMDLLIKYLGPESKKHATSMRTSNIFDISRGLRRLWERLDERYGAPEHVEASVRAKLLSFPKLGNRDHQKLYDLSDILMEMKFLKEDPKYSAMLAYLDSSSGIRPIISKLPYGLQEKWTNRAMKYKLEHQTVFPPFGVFVDFMKEMSRVKNDPSFAYHTDANHNEKQPMNVPRGRVNTKKTTVYQPTGSGNLSEPKLDVCIIHTGPGVKHSVNNCRVFKAKPIEERMKLLREHRLCFRCCSASHRKQDCKEAIMCKECGSEFHTTSLHVDSSPAPTTGRASSVHGGEEAPRRQQVTKEQHVTTINSNCTEVGKEFKGKSCARIVPATVTYDGRAVSLYAMLDDQSNKTLAKKELFDLLNINTETIPYLMTSCSGQVTTFGRTASGLYIESARGETRLPLPCTLECDEIPNNYQEIPTPDVALQHKHMRDIAGDILPIDASRKILLLIGRDLPQVHHVLEQRIGRDHEPFAQRSPLGWTIIGDTCLSGQHRPRAANVYKTFITDSGRGTILEPCAQYLSVREKLPTRDVTNRLRVSDTSSDEHLFRRTPDDNKVGSSVEDRMFMDIMNKELLIGEDGKWVAPLPFRQPRLRLPNNYEVALRRARALDASLKRDPVKKEHFATFMTKLFDNDHAEKAPTSKSTQEQWFLPLFGVYHPQKPHQIRGVFDSSAKFKGTSLNDQLLSGPNLTNSLLGVLLRFRKEMIAVVADVQHMFHCFTVREEHRDFLSFLWYKDNEIGTELTEFRMKVHVFGNSPSPAIATLGLRKISELSEESHGPDVKEFIKRNFYVDDGLTSCSTSQEAVDLMCRTQDALKQYGNLRLHKFASNSADVMKAFEPRDLAQDIYDLNLDEDQLVQRSLGMRWNLSSDMFEFRISTDDKPTTRRGVLSTVNSLFDPLGFLSPVIISGKLILRDVVTCTSDWDEPLPDHILASWEEWSSSLKELEKIHIPRTTVVHLSKAVRKELWTYADASEKAIAAVSYMKVYYEDGSAMTGFLLGKSKVAPVSGHTIPRLELCAAVLAIEISQIVMDHMDIMFDSVKYFSDSRVVLGYIHNDKRRFFIYVSNRVEKIRSLSEPSQWNFVPTHLNPADEGTRGVVPKDIGECAWLRGTTHLQRIDDETKAEGFPLQEPLSDREVRPVCLKTECEPMLGTQRYERFSSWDRLVEGIALLQRFIISRKGGKSQILPKSIDYSQRAENYIIKTVQREVYCEEIYCLRSKQPLPKNSSILALSPFLDDDGIVRVGGRLRHLNDATVCKNPILIPGKHHIATLLVRKYHQLVQHQGRHFTEGKVRSCGFWVTGCKRLVSSLIHKCVTCRRQRGSFATQKMSDLPTDRILPGEPPFTSVGVDIFGPWDVVTRRTRGVPANGKRWAALFTCLVTRAVHVEVVEEMSASSFINALKRFTAIRGQAKEYRSDRGTNFVGATDPLQIDAINVEDRQVKDFLHSRGTTWIFNPPHASHMGGAWERMIGLTRRILDNMLKDHSAQGLTHEVLTTFLAEASAIINSRPLTAVSSDPDSPFVLTPSILLTQKTDVPTEAVCDTTAKDLFKVQWKRVQHLAKMFWDKWKKEYLHTLQARKKWHHGQRNISVGDIVLLKDVETHRNNWPLGRITATFPGKDNLVRKVEVRVSKDGKTTSYVRPVTELILLLEN
ncbi:uncharacterized protein LOC128173163 [Crassostrea angulata]|uniref:uncharacterized protein LOC128173163 n=2 Tax=Magallana angulata TaxID=2784310 RepID=UPI0022B18086|nr:uncharacterized protein LOC128173163 [Crassostrea angulata]